MASSLTLTGLSAATLYEYQMRTKCNNNPAEFSAYSAVYQFTTAPFRVTDNDAAAEQLYVYPNPVSDLLYLSSDVHDANFDVVNILGAVQLSGTVRNQIQVSALPPGLYMLIIQREDKREYYRFTRM